MIYKTITMSTTSKNINLQHIAQDLETFWGPSILTEKSNPWILDTNTSSENKDTKRGGKQNIYIYTQSTVPTRKTQGLQPYTYTVPTKPLSKVSGEFRVTKQNYR